MTSRDTLRYVGRFFAMDRRHLDNRIDDVLDVVGMSDRAQRSVAGFSGGERQRLGLAQAMLHDPELLILDEPAAGLDPLGRRDVLQLLEQVRQRCTVLYLTHILDDVQRVSDTVAIIRQGVIIVQGPIGSCWPVRTARPTRLEVVGDATDVEAELRRQPWVSTIDTSVGDGRTIWHVGVTDEHAADAQLLRTVLARPDITVASFGRQRYELEDVFIQLVEQEPNR